MKRASLSYCAELIRAHDHDRYLCALFAPAAVREAWFALFAFNHELAAIPEAVSEEMIGFMRFAWWREALDEIYAGGPVRKHPVAQALAKAVADCNLPRALLDALLKAREERFGAEAFAHLEQWEGYFRATSSGLLSLCALAAHEQPTAALEDAGIAWGCIGTARGMGGEGPVAEMLVKAAETRLGTRGELPDMFAPFDETARFYLRRLKRGGKRVAENNRFLLLVRLLWRRWKGKRNISYKN